VQLVVGHDGLRDLLLLPLLLPLSLPPALLFHDPLVHLLRPAPRFSEPRLCGCVLASPPLVLLHAGLSLGLLLALLLVIILALRILLALLLVIGLALRILLALLLVIGLALRILLALLLVQRLALRLLLALLLVQRLPLGLLLLVGLRIRVRRVTLDDGEDEKTDCCHKAWFPHGFSLSGTVDRRRRV
jgi:hypothetical protein